MIRKGPKSAGFTLIELMIVVAIIGILAVISVPKFSDMVRRTKEGSTKGNLGAIRSALGIYYGDLEGAFPTAVVSPLGSLTLNGKYLASIPMSRRPDYHPDDSSVLPTGTPGPVCFDSYMGPSDFPPLSGWAYYNCYSDATWGTVLVNCTHTDSKGTLWTNY